MLVSVLAAPLIRALVPLWQGINSSFELSLQGPNANAFTVSPTTIVGTGEVQILVQNSALVDYEISHVMVVQVGLVGLACSVEAVPAPCMGPSEDTALLLQSSGAKAEQGSALAVCLVQGVWTGV